MPWPINNKNVYELVEVVEGPEEPGTIQDCPKWDCGCLLPELNHPSTFNPSSVHCPMQYNTPEQDETWLNSQIKQKK